VAKQSKPQTGLLQDIRCYPAASLLVASAKHRQTEAALAERLALHGPLRTDDATIHILVHVCGQI